MEHPSGPTIQDVIDVLHVFSTNVDERLGVIQGDITELKQDVAVLKSDVAVLKSDVAVLKSDVAVLKSEMTNVKSQMVTKEYLDDKLADLRGDLTVLTRKEDRKVLALVEILRHRNVLSDEDVRQISSMEPFPQLSL